MSISKNGIVTTNSFKESSAMNLVTDTQINNIYSYTPTTGNNSTMEGYTVDLSNCKPEEKVYLHIKVSWSGFDSSNTDGTFNIRFQGSNYSVVNNAWEWTTQYISNALNSKQSLKTLVLSDTSGTKIIETTLTIPSEVPSTYTKCRVGIRSDYSNGTGTITISDLEVIPEKYYINSGVTSLKINKDYISSNEIYEL